jgi:acyl-phosphate glycerol 3-phosphate acyltransferase
VKLILRASNQHGRHGEALRFVILVFEVLMVFNLMILVHELGHFLAARWRGLKVEAFYIWFGKPLWKKTINGVEYGLGSIPAGGFVKLPQMAPMDAIEGESTGSEPLPPVKPLDKIIVAFAGPLFSFGLACLFALLVSWLGKPQSEPFVTTTIGYVAPDSPAAKAGLQPGDVVQKIDGQPVLRFEGMGQGLLLPIPADWIQWQGQHTTQLLHVCCGLLAILGHNYSPWVGFKGGKGIATSAGVLLALFPFFGICLLVLLWLMVFLTTRYVSLASIAAAAALPILTVWGAWHHGKFQDGSWNRSLLGFSVIAGAMAIYKHRSNIQRLRAGTESRFKKSS